MSKWWYKKVERDMRQGTQDSPSLWMGILIPGFWIWGCLLIAAVVALYDLVTNALR